MLELITKWVYKRPQLFAQNATVRMRSLKWTRVEHTSPEFVRGIQGSTVGSFTTTALTVSSLGTVLETSGRDIVMVVVVTTLLALLYSFHVLSVVIVIVTQRYRMTVASCRVVLESFICLKHTSA